MRLSELILAATGLDTVRLCMLKEGKEESATSCIYAAGIKDILKNADKYVDHFTVTNELGNDGLVLSVYLKEYTQVGYRSKPYMDSQGISINPVGLQNVTLTGSKSQK